MFSGINFSEKMCYNGKKKQTMRMKEAKKIRRIADSYN